MNIWLRSLLLGLAGAAIIFFLWEKIQGEPLFREYTAHYKLKAVPDTGSSIPFSLPATMSVINRRLQDMDHEFELKKTGVNTFEVIISETDDTTSIGATLTSNGRVQFREMYTMEELVPMLTSAIGTIRELHPPPPLPAPEKRDSISKAVSDLLDTMEQREQREMANEKTWELIEFVNPYTDQGSGRVVYPAEIGKVKPGDTAEIRRIFQLPKIKNTGPADALLCFGVSQKGYSAKKEKYSIPVYFLKTLGRIDKAILENEDIEDARVDFSPEGQVELAIRFSNSGTGKWAAMTKRNINRPIAIVVNGSVFSAPNVLSEIPNGHCIISGSYSMNEADLLALQIKGSRLPATVSILSSKIKSETMVRESTSKLIAALAVFILLSFLGFFLIKMLKVN